jgi:hypothetical protein
MRCLKRPRIRGNRKRRSEPEQQQVRTKLATASTTQQSFNERAVKTSKNSRVLRANRLGYDRCTIRGAGLHKAQQRKAGEAHLKSTRLNLGNLSKVLTRAKIQLFKLHDSAVRRLRGPSQTPEPIALNCSTPQGKRSAAC